MEVSVAATSGTFEGSRVRRVGGRGRHELTTPIKCMSSYACSMVLEAFLVGKNHHGRWLWRRWSGGGVALVCAVGERLRLGGLGWCGLGNCCGI